MRFEVVIDCDNDAFGEYPQGEVCEILRRLAATVDAGYHAGTIADSNGNPCGSFAFLPEAGA